LGQIASHSGSNTIYAQPGGGKPYLMRFKVGVGVFWGILWQWHVGPAPIRTLDGAILSIMPTTQMIARVSDESIVVRMGEEIAMTIGCKTPVTKLVHNRPTFV
jgi:hypothetical protein